MKVLMVCLGNICRSPMAEGILREEAKKRGLNIHTDSCGTNGFHNGELPDNRAISQLRKNEIDITDLRSRKFKLSDFNEFDQIFAMDASNENDILKLAPDTHAKSKVKMYMEHSFPGEKISVPDPYYGGDDGFQKVYEMLIQATNDFLDQTYE